MNFKIAKPLSGKKEFYLILVSLFFVFHEYVTNFPVIPVGAALLILGKYLLATVVIYSISVLFFRSSQKAGLFTLLLMGMNYFFGAVHDFLKENLPNAFIVKYTFLLPFILFMLVVVAVLLKRTKKTFPRTTTFFNLLFIVLIAVDVVSLFPKFPNKVLAVSPPQLSACDSCGRPDVYVIIADEYAGKQELQDVFSFDNTPFQKELEKRGFHWVENSKSNYNATVYSMSSMLNMNYLENLTAKKINLQDMFLCRDMIRENQVVNYLKDLGYGVHNFSFFDIEEKDHYVTNLFFKTYDDLVSAQTMINRVIYHIGFHFYSEEKVAKAKKNNLYNDWKLENATKKVVTAASPKFVYTHFTMPHHPYFVDSNGKETDHKLLTYKYTEDKNAYIEYLHYTNRKLLEVIDHIRAQSKQPPVVVLMSDHGWRQFPEKGEEKYYFMNLNAVFLPNQNYSGFYNGMSNVNQFRVILNAQFGQRLPMLPDSTKFLVE